MMAPDELLERLLPRGPRERYQALHWELAAAQDRERDELAGACLSVARLLVWAAVAARAARAHPQRRERWLDTGAKLLDQAAGLLAGEEASR